MTEILLLGTFHFSEERDIDFYSGDIQNELELMVKKLLTFNPDVIAIERAINEQENIVKSYEKFDLKDLQDRNKMQNETLGEICMFGHRVPIRYNNESVQIGYRLGKLLGHSRVYAIDNDMSINMEVLNTPSLSFKEALDVIQADMDKHTNETIADMYKYYNSEKWSIMNHNLYIQANMISTDNHYAGAEMVSKWYERNLKIFSNIQRLAVEHERIFIIYGAGHLKILRDLINEDSNLKLVDVNEYL